MRSQRESPFNSITKIQESSWFSGSTMHINAECNPTIYYKRAKDIGTKLSYDAKARKFFDTKSTKKNRSAAKRRPEILTAQTELNTRTCYMFATDRPLTLKELTAYSISGRGKEYPAFLYYAKFMASTFLVLKFNQGSCRVDIEWEELNESTIITVVAKTSPRDSLHSSDEQIVPTPSFEEFMTLETPGEVTSVMDGNQTSHFETPREEISTHPDQMQIAEE